ncbi:MAG: serine/threonine protein kinase [Balneolaceae bacterium]|nr:MAG: serine/threonine protein kinase [Balneolaceae bacterium]
MSEASSILVNEITSLETAVDINMIFPALQQAGPYRVIKLIARGGMGNVYLAERSDGQFQRTVAIKILRHELGAESHIQRFMTERDILSGLEHPNIARLYDGGITDDNRPYLVMEYIDGVPISYYCKENNSTLKEKIELFRQVCKAVEYAHRNLIVHRDLKPDNILVKEDGTVKVLDFGIAKIIDEELTNKMLNQTRENLHMLSIQYAAPEQITLEKITTSTDVYTLGLLLYEMVTGHQPFDLKGKKLKEAEQIIRNQTPEKPSLRISDPAKVRKIKGDLDAIILQALRKEPENRYQTAGQLLDDIQRFVNDRPVKARPITLIYKTKKFIIRRPKVVAALFTGILAVLFYIITLQVHADQLETERNIALIETEKAEAISDFVIMLFEANNPDVEEDNIPTVFELLERGVRRAELLEGQPEITAQMLDVIAQMYGKLGQYRLSGSLFRQVVDIRREIYSEPNAHLAVALDRFGDALLRSGYLDEAEEILLEAKNIAKSLENRLVEADVINDLGLIYYERGNYTAAEESHRRALDLRQAALGNTHYRVGVSLNNLALALESQEKMDEAEEMYLQALSVKRKTVSDEHSSVTRTTAQLGRLYMEMGKLEQAATLLTNSLEINRRRLGSQHPRIAADLNDLAALYSRQGQYQMAVMLFREALEIREATQVENSTEIAISLANLATVLLHKKNFIEALPLARRAVDIARERWGTQHLNTAIFIHNLGSTQQRLGMHLEAETSFREATLLMGQILRESHPLIAHPMMRLGELLTDTGRAPEAEPLLREALDLRVNADNDPADIAQVQFFLGVNLAELSQFDEAEALLRSALQTRLDLHDVDHPDVTTSQEQLNNLLAKKQLSEN